MGHHHSTAKEAFVSRAAKLSQLFARGIPVVLPTASGPPEVVWVTKLNSFQIEECNHEGRVARARKMAMIRDIGSPEYDLFTRASLDLTSEEIINGLVRGMERDHMAEVFADVRSDEEWREKVTVIEHSDDQLAGRDEDDEERLYLQQLVEAYHTEIMKRLERVQSDYRAELTDLNRDDLRERYLEQYIEERGLRAFTSRRQQYEIYLATRVCTARPPGDEEQWDHSGCDHTQKYLDRPEEVATVLPDDVVNLLREAYEGLMVEQDLARFTGGPASSSDSSGPASNVEASPESGPTEPPTQPVTTSS